MTLEKIFESNPKLLEEKEVKDLIEHAKRRHAQVYDIAKKCQDFQDFVREKIIHSELLLIDGQDSKECLEDILMKL